MPRVNREIIKRAKCNVLDITVSTHETHKKELTRRLKRQEKALIKTIERNWLGREMIEENVANIKITLEVLNNWE